MKRLSQARALIEAELDFTDEWDIPGSVSDQVWQDMQLLADEMAAALDDHTAEIVREGFRVAIAGPPNAGKSSLMNFLAKRDVAIVTDIAGTTRDVLSVDLDLDGNRIVLFDTAGLRETEDPVERIGIERARQTINAADLVLHLVDLGEPTSLDLHDTSKLDSDMIVVRTKRDRHHPAEAAGGLSVSTVTGEGVDSLLKQISQRASVAVQGGQLVTPLLIRHRNHISAACDWVRAAGAAEDHALELRAEMLRSAADDLAHLTGRVTPDALLGLIFSQFCVGK
jgi:tRNA modification GTPase